MSYTGERAIPWNGNVGVNVMTHHIRRYAWATPFAWQKKVADLGCGVGYGSYLLSMVARSAVGCDVDFLAVAYAQDTFKTGNLHYEIRDISEGIPRAELYTAFEVLEHLADPLPTLTMIAELEGVLVWSIPVNSATKWHKRVYSVKDIKNLMAGSDFYYQGANGYIAPEAFAWFDPVYILGVIG